MANYNELFNDKTPVTTLQLPWPGGPCLHYHATWYKNLSSIRSGIDFSEARPNTDFGRGFYSTTSYAQAKRLATSMANARGEETVVIIFEINREALANLPSLVFIRGDRTNRDYWELIKTFRLGRAAEAEEAVKCYDVIIGMVALEWDDDVCIANPTYDQFCFKKADSATSVLKYSRHEVVKPQPQ
ncbi:MAG: DUF3990 domain-containing protein [Candidatus Obscuribacterales bacterium]|nr:DUF3990 domain-containing protein [Candidatus Obscuribacterales bacterium]